MRLKVLLILFFFSTAAQAQDYFVARATKDNQDDYMLFYDMNEKFIPVEFSFSEEENTRDLLLYYAFQNKSKGNLTLDIYGNIIPISQRKFIYNIPINDTFIKSGNYRLVFRLQKNNEMVQEKDLYFQTLREPNNFFKGRSVAHSLIQKKVTHSVSDIDVSKTFVDKYSLADIKRNINALTPIADKAEQGALEGITLGKNEEELKRFFYNFWYARNPQNPEAEWKAYADKLNYVSRKFGYGTLKGYQTDRGMLYLKFGPPNREVRASSERGTKPYEVWFYAELDKFTNLNILFVQQGALTNERVLTHSSDPNFFFNPNWAAQLFTDISEQYNKNSHRVYEFFK